MTDEAVAQAAKKRKIEPDLMISTLQAEADHYRAWAAAVTDGNRAGLEGRAAVLERAADVVAWVRDSEALIREWQASKRKRV